MDSGRIDKLIEELSAKIREHPKVAIAFSGGVDSSVVAKMAKMECGTSLAVTIDSTLLPEGELENARNMAREIGIEHTILNADALANKEVAANGPDRCYFCKKMLFSKIKESVSKDAVILDGSNFSERSERRPGMLAAKELGIISPLADAEIRKKDAREIARSLGLSNWSKPSMACLASRIPYGTRLSRERIQRVDAAEKMLRSLGFSCVRIREHDTLARIEIDAAKFPLALEKKKQIIAGLRELGYSYVTLDLEGYTSGSMDRQLRAEKRK